jgi:hypothetical protein
VARRPGVRPGRAAGRRPRAAPPRAERSVVAWDAQDLHGFAREENKRPVGQRTRRLGQRTRRRCARQASNRRVGWPSRRTLACGAPNQQLRQRVAVRMVACVRPTQAAAGRPAGGWQGGRGCGPPATSPGARHGAAARRDHFPIRCHRGERYRETGTPDNARWPLQGLQRGHIPLKCVSRRTYDRKLGRAGSRRVAPDRPVLG